MSVNINNNLDVFNEALGKAIEKHNVDSETELKEVVPPQDAEKYGKIEAVKLNGLALTSDGAITRTSYFDNIDIKEEFYGNIVLSSEEAKKLAMTFKHLVKGVNALVPLTCTGPRCPFADQCPLVQMNKAPIGKPCLLEYELLDYNTKRFIEEFDVDMNNYSEVMMIQELSELIVYEMRASRALADPENAQLFGIRFKFSPEGEAIEEQVIHWAWELKEKIKNRRMRILDALMATRKNKASVKDKKEDKESALYYRQMADLINSIDKVRTNYTNIEEGNYEEM